MAARVLTIRQGERVDRHALVGTLLLDALDPSYGLAVALVGDRRLAEDATHDAVVRALTSARTLRDPAAFHHWFRRILVNACRDALKRRGRERSDPLELAPDIGVPDASGSWPEREAIARAVARLSPDHREVVVLRYYADLPVEDIAGALGVRVGTVKSRLHYALRRLRAEYDADGRIHPEGER